MPLRLPAETTFGIAGNRRKDEHAMKKLTFHHSALSRGYIRVGETKEETYNGRFGVGKRIYKHNPLSSRYCIIEYWVEE